MHPSSIDPEVLPPTLAERFAAADAVVTASTADMGDVIAMVRRGDVEGAQAAAGAFGRRLGSRVRAALGLSGDADG